VTGFNVPTVPVLLAGRRPAAVRRLVVAVAIWPAIQGFAGWTLAHVGKEVLEYLPALTNQDTALRIVARLMVFQTATADHLGPRVVGARCAARGVSVDVFCLGSDNTAQTTAGLRPPVSQPNSANYGFLPAIAAAQPRSEAARDSATRKHDQSSEALARYIDKPGHYAFISNEGELDKLDELIRSNENARNDLIAIERDDGGKVLPDGN
jgi:hypothetical protein